MIKKSALFTVAWIVSCCLTIAWTKWGVLSSVDQQYQHAYASIAPSKIYSGEMYNDAVNFMLDKISIELDTLHINGVIPVLRVCHIQNLHAEREMTRSSRLVQRLQFKLILDDPHHHLSYTGAAKCQIDWINLLGSQFLFCLVIVLILYCLPHPLTHAEASLIARYQALNWPRHHIERLRRCSPNQQEWVQAILAHPHLSTMPVDAILSGISAQNPGPVSSDTEPWLALAYERTDNPSQAFAVAFHNTDTLVFDVRHRSVVIHGITIKLSPTPYYYYLWYALKRQNTESGWVLNPLTTKADHGLAEQLISLMQQHGGHAKAINDLHRNGLTAKKLDQNRNKIKEEITAILGDELASPYLFEARRDPTSMRYDYRIASPANKIKIT